MTCAEAKNYLEEFLPLIRDIPNDLKNHYDHTDMGIYTEVLVGGSIKVGDEIEVV